MAQTGDARTHYTQEIRFAPVVSTVTVYTAIRVVPGYLFGG